MFLIIELKRSCIPFPHFGRKYLSPIYMKEKTNWLVVDDLLNNDGNMAA